MKPYDKKGTEKTQSMEGRLYWVAVVTFAQGATIQFDDGFQFPIRGNWVLTPPLDHKGHIVPWKLITTTGAVSLLVGEHLERPPPSAGALLPSVPAVALANVGIITAANPGPTVILATNLAQRSVLIQNHGVSVVKVFSDVAADDAHLLAILSACTAVRDGTGGVLELDGFNGPLWASGVTAPSDLSVNAW